MSAPRSALRGHLYTCPPVLAGIDSPINPARAVDRAGKARKEERDPGFGVPQVLAVVRAHTHTLALNPRRLRLALVSSFSAFVLVGVGVGGD